MQRARFETSIFFFGAENLTINSTPFRAMKYISVCSGIEAATVAWHPLGWEAVAYSEIEKFPSQVLATRYPETPNLGDMTKFKEWPDANVDLLVGGTPCQSFSVAGLRKGLADPRGNLMLTYLAIADRYRPRWLVWENVPGVLSSNGGRDFGTFLGGLGQLGYGFAYRVLDAQYVRVESHSRAVPQRRRRVFVVGCLGDWRRAAAVLFERESLCRNTPPSRKTGAAVAALTSSGVGTCGTDDNQGQAGHLIAEVSAPLGAGDGSRGWRNDLDQGAFIPQVSGCMAHGQAWAEIVSDASPSLTCNHEAPIVFSQYGDIAGGLTARHDSSPCADRGMSVIAIHGTQDPDINCEFAHPLGRNNGGENALCIPLQEVGKRTGKSTDDQRAGIGIGNDGDPSYTLQSGANHGVFTLAIRGRGDSHQLEFRNDGSSNAILTPNGGRGGIGVGAVAFTVSKNSNGFCWEKDVSPTIDVTGGKMSNQQYGVPQNMQVRRLTPTECERLQGFPDGYTDIPMSKGRAADGPRYKALGNSMAVNCMRWIGDRIQAVDAIPNTIKAGKKAVSV